MLCINPGGRVLYVVLFGSIVVDGVSSFVVENSIFDWKMENVRQ